MFLITKFKDSQKLSIALLVTDLIFLIIHLLFVTNQVSSPMFSIFQDLGYSEIYQYIKEIWIFIFLVLLFLTHRAKIFLAWSFLFGYFFLDDSVRIHERLGSEIAKILNFPEAFGLRPHDFGELAVSAFFGTIIFAFIWICYKQTSATRKLISKRIFKLILALVFFGILFDTIHAALDFGYYFFGFIEDGGEMIVMSLILGYVYSLPLFYNDRIVKPKAKRII